MHTPSGEGKGYDPGIKACKEGDYTKRTFFYMYLGAKYMRMPKFWKIPKMYNPLGILSCNPMASI